MSATVKQLREWLEKLPPDFDDAPIEGTLSAGFPAAAKRVIAYRWKDESQMPGIAVNPMGTHYSDEWAKDVEFVSILQP